MDLELNLTVSGSPRDLINGLKRTIKHLENCSSEELAELQYEDATVYAEAKILESNDY